MNQLIKMDANYISVTTAIGLVVDDYGSFFGHYTKSYSADREWLHQCLATNWLSLKVLIDD